MLPFCSSSQCKQKEGRRSNVAFMFHDWQRLPLVPLRIVDLGTNRVALRNVEIFAGVAPHVNYAPFLAHHLEAAAFDVRLKAWS